MQSEEDDLKPEREQTDESLRNERTKTDEELRARLMVLEADAAKIVARARESADAVVATARENADEDPSLARPRRRRASDRAIHEARAVEDENLARERGVTDDKLRRNTEHISALLRLLPAERDRTDQHLLSEREQADEAISHRDDFLSIVSHDLRSLLATVSLGAQLIERVAKAGEGEDSTVRSAQRIRRAAHHMNRLIGDLVDVSAIEAGRLAITVAPVDATALVAEVIGTFQQAAAAKGLSLTPARVEADLAGSFDRDRALQVFANLVGNSLKFTPTGGAVRVGGERVGAELRFSVSDDGPGIPAGKREAVFERFWQVGENDRRGLGLGLYIAKSIVEAQGGRIWVESTPGEGSTFFFTVPAMTGFVARSARSSGAS
jgi:signal transduction histidine kinase